MGIERNRRRARVGRLEPLEARALMAGTVNGGWPGPHNIALTLDNGSVSALPGVDLTVNKAQLEAGMGAGDFSGTIIGPAPVFIHPGQAAVHFKVNGQAADAATVTTFSASTPSPFPGRGQVSFSGASVPLVANQDNTLNVSVTAVGFPTATPFPNLVVRVDTLPPSVTGVGPVEPDPRGTPVSAVNVTLSEPVDLSTFTGADLTLTRDGSAVVPPPPFTVSAVAGSPGTYTIGGLAGSTGAAGTYVLTVNAAGINDLAGNPGVGSMADSWRLDPNIIPLPAPPPPVLVSTSDTGFSSTDRVTNAQAPAFLVSGVGPGATVQLLRDHVVIGAPRIGPGPIVDPSAPEGSHVYTLRQVGPTGTPGLESTPLPVLIDRVGPAITVVLGPERRAFVNDTQFATLDPRPTIQVQVNHPAGNPNPADRVVVGLAAIDGVGLAAPVLAPPSAEGATVALTVPVNLAPGRHVATVQAIDAAGNPVTRSLPFVVVASPSASAPGTPVYSEVFDLSGLKDLVEPNSKATGGENPWNIAFDRTTQTLWIALRGGESGQFGGGTEDTSPTSGGNRVMQLDPATNRITVYNLNGIARNSGPHGITFDFESHITPRAWFAQRDAGLLTYVDVAAQQVVSYNVRAILKDLNVTQPDGKPAVADLHAVAVDRRGHVWVSDLSERLLLEFDFSRLADGSPTATLNSDVGVLTIHRIPANVFGAADPGDVGLVETGPHGLDVVVDDRTNQAYVWFTEIGTGRVALLRPDVGTVGADLWDAWQLTDSTAPLFVSVDTAETPGYPEDDRVVFNDPGSQLFKQSVIGELDPGLFPGDGPPSIRTWEIPAPGSPPGSPSTKPLARPNQTFVDREGTVFYIDRQYGVGRLDPAEIPGAPGVTPRHFQGISLSTTVGTGKPLRSPGPIPQILNPPQHPTDVTDVSGIEGLDQYGLLGATKPGRLGAPFNGPFRGALNAGNVLLSSLTQTDQVAATIFAETARRQMDVVPGPGNARQGFQVLRDGSLILTERAPTATADRQVNLTVALNGPALQGDPSAVRDAAGIVHVFGRDLMNNLAEYRFDPASATWSARSLAAAPAGAGYLVSDLATIAPAGGGVGVLGTTNLGHLVLFRPDTGAVVDLTGDSGVKVYSGPGVVELNGRISAYATNQTGALIEYGFNPDGGAVTSRTVPLPPGADTRVFQDVEAVAAGPIRHVFAIDANSRLVHVTIQPDGTASAENVTELGKDLAAGYSTYQQPFAGRIYTEVAPLVAPDGTLIVYGTNARDLIEFRQSPGGPWRITDLTNTLPANKVFGAPGAYLDASGLPHVLQINEDAEVIEYFQVVPGGPFSTQNITLLVGNSGSPPVFPGNLSTLPRSPMNQPPAPVPPVVLDRLSFDPTGLHAVGAGFVEAPRDRDVIRFVAPHSGRITIRLATPNSDLDTILSLAGPHHRPAFRNDNASRGTTDSRVTADVVAGRVYTILVQGRFDSIGRYDLSLDYLRTTAAPRPGHAPRQPAHPRRPHPIPIRPGAFPTRRAASHPRPSSAPRPRLRPD